MFKKKWPIFCLVFISFALFLTNYVPGTYLIGWDNTVPEFNLSLNFSRIIFGIWQEYRGLGSLDGMAHTANIVHWLYIALLSQLLPQNIVRYVFHLLMHLLGGIGMFYLVKNEVLPNIFAKKKKAIFVQVSSLLSALLYQFNLMTIQMFYMPLAVFSIHFAAIPWMLLTLLKYLKKPSAKNLGFFAAVNLLSISQAHVPSVFISYVVIIFLVLLSHLWFHKKIKPIISVVLVLIGINAFWGVPYLYSAWQKAPEIGQSQINRLSTDEIFYRNLAWGDLKSVLTFGGFNLAYLDWNQHASEFQLMLSSWVESYKSKTYQLTTIFLSVLGMTGMVVATIRTKSKKKWLSISLSLPLLFFFTQLANNTWGIKIISQIFRKYVPFFHDIFRFTLTKFSLSYVAFLSIFFGVSILSLFNILKKVSWNKFLPLFVGIIFSGLILGINLKAFKSQFFYSQLRQRIPAAYFELIDFFNQQPHQRRIAVLPMPNLYGWTQNKWGYRGSGFIWQALPQPQLDRAFDAWSAKNETFYNQLSTALTQKNMGLFEKTLSKYQISYLLIDKSLYAPNKPDDLLQLEEITSYLTEIGGDKIWEKDFLIAYDLSSLIESTVPIYVPHKATLVTSLDGDYTQFDPAYFQLENYIENPGNGIDFPFIDLIKYRSIEADLENNRAVTTHQVSSNSYNLVFPTNQSISRISPVIHISYLDDQIELEFEPLLIINSQPIGKLPNRVFELKSDPAELVLQINQNVIEIKKGETITTQLAPIPLDQSISILYFDKKSATYQNNEITIDTQNAHQKTIFINFQKELNIPDSIKLEINNQVKLEIPTTTKNLLLDYRFSSPQNCDHFKKGTINKKSVEGKIVLTANNSAAICDKIIMSDNYTDESSLIFIDGQNIIGRNLKLVIENPIAHRDAAIDLMAEQEFSAVYSLQPWLNLNQGKNNISLESKSFSGVSSQNQVDRLISARLTIDSNWISQIYIKPSVKSTEFLTQNKNSISQVKKYGVAFYQFESNSNQELLVVLNQGFDRGWIAISKNHVLPHFSFNGWANSWAIPSGNNRTIIFYWPQLVVFGGYGLLMSTIIYLIKIIIKENKRPQKYVGIKHKTKRRLQGK